MDNAKDSLKNQAARDYMDLVFTYKRLGVAQHILSELSGWGVLNERGAALYDYAAYEENRCLEKLHDAHVKMCSRPAK